MGLLDALLDKRLKLYKTFKSKEYTFKLLGWL